MDPVERSNIIPVDNETTSSVSRTSKDGKLITYRLEVIQQPVRARACGAGAKSSADRRPVDPPPIVELKIYEGEGPDQQDITFRILANYFLFATLEQARPIAHGRMPEEKRQASATVLTGTPVAGMVYLDRPKPAGYFIFPDLSVRHEGKYRLSFSLYEELKNAQDEDLRESSPRSASPDNGHVTHRLEVKSEPFVVFSAKKFPGLSESTYLSRTVAEQGCRVRIRRDVRMRRRETKGGKDWDGYEDETAQARARMSATPEGSAYPTLPAPPGYPESVSRPRSASNASHQSIPPLPLSRRTSLQEIGHAYHHPLATTPHTPQNGYAETSPYGPSPTHSFPQPPFIQQPPPMQPPSHHFHSQSHAPPPVSAPVSSQQSYYAYASAPPSATVAHSHYGPPPMSYDAAPQEHRSSADYSAHAPMDFRRATVPYSASHMPEASYGSQGPPSSYSAYPQARAQSFHAPQPPPLSHLSMPLHQPSQQQHYGPPEMYGTRPPPLEPVHPPARMNGVSTPLSARPSFDRQVPSFALPPLQTTSDMSHKLEASSPTTSVPKGAYYSSASTPIESHKRAFSSVFNDSHVNQPLRHGARPSTPGGHSMTYGNNGLYIPAAEADDNGDPFQSSKPMEYKRADGSSQRRYIPMHDWSRQ